jgi:hypothetical protein
MKAILPRELVMTMRLRPAGVLAALLVMRACTSEGAVVTTAPSTTRTTSPASVGISRRRGDHDPGRLHSHRLHAHWVVRILQRQQVMKLAAR